MSGVALTLIIWTATSFPLGMIVGKFLRYRSATCDVAADLPRVGGGNVIPISRAFTLSPGPANLGGEGCALPVISGESA